jgi:hypothetical protein
MAWVAPPLQLPVLAPAFSSGHESTTFRHIGGQSTSDIRGMARSPALVMCTGCKEKEIKKGKASSRKHDRAHDPRLQASGALCGSTAGRGGGTRTTWRGHESNCEIT